MNMTITHGYGPGHHSLQGNGGSHAPPQYPKNQMIGNHVGNQHPIGTANAGLRPTKMM